MSTARCSLIQWKSLPKLLRYLLYAVFFCIVFYFALRWVFPGRFDPFTPHQSDILDYPYDFGGGNYNLDSRPVGLILTWIFGLFGAWHGVILSALFSTILSMLLIIDIAEIETGASPSAAAVVCYSILLFTAPSFYINYSFDIYSTYALVIGLAAVRCTYYSPKRMSKARQLAFALLILAAFMSKETYIVFFGFFFLVNSIVRRGDNRRAAVHYLLITILAGTFALAYAKLSGSAFVTLDAQNTENPYFISLTPSSILHIFYYYLKWALNLPIVVMLAAAWIWTFWNRRNRERTASYLVAFCLAGVFAFLPYSVLPNHVVPHYSFAAVPLLYAAVFIVDKMLRELKTAKWLVYPAMAAICVLFVVSGAFSASDGYTDVRPWIACETDMRKTLQSIDEINECVEDGDEVLVVGIEDTVETLYKSVYAVDKLLTDEAHFDVLCSNEEYCGDISEKVTYISSVQRDDYDVLVLYGAETCDVRRIGSSLELQERLGTYLQQCDAESGKPAVSVQSAELYKPDGQPFLLLYGSGFNNDTILYINGERTELQVLNDRTGYAGLGGIADGTVVKIVLSSSLFGDMEFPGNFAEVQYSTEDAATQWAEYAASLRLNSIYPGTEIKKEQSLPDGSLNLGIECSRIDLCPQIVVNGTAVETQYGDGFISANIPESYFSDGSMHIGLRYPGITELIGGTDIAVQQ